MRANPFTHFTDITIAILYTLSIAISFGIVTAAYTQGLLSAALAMAAGLIVGGSFLARAVKRAYWPGSEPIPTPLSVPSGANGEIFAPAIDAGGRDQTARCTRARRREAAGAQITDLERWAHEFRTPKASQLLEAMSLRSGASRDV